MRPCHGFAVALAALSACAPVVDVYPLHPTPRCLMARALASVKVYPSYPTGGVAVYTLDATNGSEDELNAAVHSKAADLGCDGVIIGPRESSTEARGAAATGQLNDYREAVPGHVKAVCIVMK